MAGLDLRRIKAHRSYNVAEAARALGVTGGTVRRCIKNGLPAFTERRPYLIRGSDLKRHLAATRGPKVACAIDQFFCFACREPRRPRLGIAAFRPTTPTNGMLNAHCEACGNAVFRRFTIARLPELARANVQVTSEQGDPDLSQHPSSFPDNHFEKASEHA